MPWAISVKATRADNRTITELWNRFGQLELSPSMPALNYPPHVTLGVYNDLDVDAAAAAVDELAAGQNVLKLSFAQLEYFQLPSFVVWAKPVDNRGLAQLHRKLHSLLGQCDCHEYYKPGNWIPHCSVATDIPLERRDEALAQMAEPVESFEVTFDAIDCVEFPPVRVVHQVQL